MGRAKKQSHLYQRAPKCLRHCQYQVHLEIRAMMVLKMEGMGESRFKRQNDNLSHPLPLFHTAGSLSHLIKRLKDYTMRKESRGFLDWGIQGTSEGYSTNSIKNKEIKSTCGILCYLQTLSLFSSKKAGNQVYPLQQDAE